MFPAGRPAMRIAEHARRRLWERFPHVNMSMENLLKNKIPYGAWTTNTEVYMNIEHKVVIVVAINKEVGKTVVTVLTEDFYRTNFENINNNSYKKKAIVGLVQEDCNSRKKENSKAEDKKSELEEIIKLFAENYAQEIELTYPELKERKNEIRERFTLSRKQFDFFVEKYFAYFRKKYEKK